MSYYSDKQMEVITASYRQRIAELEAQLAAVPKWVKITDDPQSWPPDDMDDVLFANPNEDPRWIWEYNVNDEWNRGGASYWLPITPPQVET